MRVFAAWWFGLEAHYSNVHFTTLLNSAQLMSSQCLHRPVLPCFLTVPYPAALVELLLIDFPVSAILNH